MGRRADYQLPGTVPERIKAGLFGYGVKLHATVAPAPGSLHAAWPDDLRRFFDRCFEPGGDPRLRPSAQDWQTLQPTVYRFDLEQSDTTHDELTK